MKTKFDFSITGFIIALIVVSMTVGAFGLFLSDMNNEYNINATNILDKYNISGELNNQTKDIKESTENIGGGNIVTQVLDIVGVFFSGGWDAIRTSFKSFELFGSLMGDVGEDIPALKFFLDYLTSIVIIIIFLGVGAGVLLKWRI